MLLAPTCMMRYPCALFRALWADGLMKKFGKIPRTSLEVGVETAPRIAILIGFQYTSWIRGSDQNNTRIVEEMTSWVSDGLSYPIPIE